MDIRAVVVCVNVVSAGRSDESVSKVAGALPLEELDRAADLVEPGHARLDRNPALELHTGKQAEEIRKDIERDKILTADQAKEYGFVDEVLPYRKLSTKP